MNSVVLMGRIARNLEIKNTEKTSVLKFTIAVTRNYKKGETDFINCTAFGGVAEFIAKYFSKGKMIAVEGVIRTNNYTNKNGDKVFNTEVLVEKAEFCGSKEVQDEEVEENYLKENEGDFLPF